VLIVIMGGRWLELLKAKNSSGQRDYVREEISAALQRRIVVIPARIGREGQLPSLPSAEDLPPDLKDLVGYQQHDITHERFGRDIAELIEAIMTVRRTKRISLPAQRSHWTWGWAAAAMAAVFVGAAVIVGGHYRGLPEAWRVSIAGLFDLFGNHDATASKQSEHQATAEERQTPLLTYSKFGNFWCVGGAEYPSSWREEAAICRPSWGCNFGYKSQDACLNLAAKKQSKTVIFGTTGIYANECWLQHSCGNLQRNDGFTMFVSPQN
jgi:hypothetical protein